LRTPRSIENTHESKQGEALQSKNSCSSALRDVVFETVASR
jgi:hypothetical protein